MIITLIIAVLATAILGGYTLAFEKATRHWGQVFADSPTEEDLVFEARMQGKTEPYAKGYAAGYSITIRGAQDAITPPAQKTRDLLFPVFTFIVVPIFAFIAFRWWAAPLVMPVTFILAGILRSFFPAPPSAYFLREIRRGLEKKKNSYGQHGDTLRVEACQFFIDKVQAELGE